VACTTPKRRSKCGCPWFTPRDYPIQATLASG
jgi:hypothetical protein